MPILVAIILLPIFSLVNYSEVCTADIVETMTDHNDIDDNDTLDQHQDWGSAQWALIYEDRWYAQSFIPSFADVLTRVEICIKKFERRLSIAERINRFPIFEKLRLNEKFPRFSILINKTFSILSSFLSIPYKHNPQPRWNKPGDLIVSIRGNLLGKDLATARISYDELERDEVVWVELDFPDIDVSDYMYSDELDSVTKHLYIVVHTTGGDEKNCYAWLYDSTVDRYEKGSKFSSYSAGKNWYEDEGEDFCFRTYGKDRPGDGIVERWAFFVGAPCPYTDRDAYGLRDVLYEKNPEEWPYDHIYVLVNEKSTMTNVRKGFHWIDKMEDGDDVLFFMFSGHGVKGGGIRLAQDPNDILNQELNDSKIDEELDKMGSRSILVIIDSCGSGEAIYKPNGSKLYLPSDGRVIMASSNASESSWGGTSKLKISIFTYYLIEAFSGKGDLNKDKIVSAEESFKYAAPRTASHVFWGRYKQHPDISDGYPTLKDNEDELPVVVLK